MQIPIAQPSLATKENDAVLASGTISRTQVTAAFEEEFADFCAFSVNSGTAALHEARIGPGDEVVAPVHPNVTGAGRACVCKTIGGVI